MSDNIFNTFKHLVTRSQAWRLVASPFREYIQGFSYFPATLRDFIDRVWLDIFPSETRELAKWEQQFDLTQSGTITERTNNLDGRWKAMGGQGLDYLQDLIHSHGYTDVYLHEWWIGVDAWQCYCLAPDSDCGSDAAECGVVAEAITVKDPNDYIDTVYLTYCLGPDSDCGSSEAECGGVISEGTLLVNKGPEVVSYEYQTYCLGVDSDCGATDAECGVITGTSFIPIPYYIPQDEDDWHYIIYVAGEVWGEYADVPAELQGEFERLLLSIMPYQQWMGLMINYV